MFDFLKRKEYLKDAFEFLHTDIHSHVLPCIDDGSKSVAESILLIEGLYNLGFRKLIATPHIYDDFYKNSYETIEPVFSSLKEAIEKKSETVQLLYSAEYYVDEHFEEKVSSNQLLPFPSNHVLIEMSFVAYNHRLEEVIFDLVTRGYKPILAHPERYSYLENNLRYFQKLVELGCELQININSLGGYYGKGAELLAKELLDKELASYLGTDLHNEKHLSFLQGLSKKKNLMKMLRRYDWKNSDL
jgi:tyrosine-protein phosphatase YwqE